MELDRAFVILKEIAYDIEIEAKDGYCLINLYDKLEKLRSSGQYQKALDLVPERCNGLDVSKVFIYHGGRKRIEFLL